MLYKDIRADLSRVGRHGFLRPRCLAGILFDMNLNLLMHVD